MDAWRGFADNSAMRRIEDKQRDCDLTSVGAALVGHYRKALTPQGARLDAAQRGGVSNSDVLRSNVGLLVQGKSDCDAVEGRRNDKF
jgi:hypothetical protein